MITDSSIVVVVGFIVMIVLLFLLITCYKWYVFIALLLPILLFGMISGISWSDFIDAFEQGFGWTIQGIAVVIVFGSILVEVLKYMGGVERITFFMIRWVGECRMLLVLMLSGFVIGFVIFSDVGYVILNLLVHLAVLAVGVNMSVMGIGLVGVM